MCIIDAGIVQLVEHQISNLIVSGSSPDVRF